MRAVEERDRFLEELGAERERANRLEEELGDACKSLLARLFGR